MSYVQSRFWHPRQNPSAIAEHQPLRIVRGDGCYVFDEQGRRLLDGTAGLFNVYIGHNRAEVKQAIVEQLDELEYYPAFAGLSHPRAEELSARLIDLLEPEDMRRVIYGSGGSDAVDTALLLSRQYWKVIGQPERSKFISLKQGYHGSHFGGVSVTGNTAYRRNYEPLLSGCFHVETPWPYRNPFTDDIEELGHICAILLEREILFQNPDTVAAFIAEPIQSTGGIIVPPANYWPLVRKVCDKYGVLLIADEVTTGFGRTGCMFGSRGWKVAPDIMCLAKGISSGYVPLGATVFNRRIEEAFLKNTDSIGTIMHGYTYSGHPVACAAGLANLRIIVEENLTDKADTQGKYLMHRLKPFEEKFAVVGEVRGKGLLIGIDLVKDKKTREPIDTTGVYAMALAEAALKEGVLIKALGNRLGIAPPLVIQQEQLDNLIDVLETAFINTPDIF
jgi:putrescine---pyruvate transaminase